MSVLAVGTAKSETTRRLIEEAGAYAACTAQPLVVAYIITEKQFRARQNTYRGLQQFNAEYSVEQAESSAKELARQFASDALHDDSEEYLYVGEVGSPHRVIPRLAHEHECEHIFISRQHQPWYRLLSRDLVDDVSQAFSGFITTQSEKAH